MAEVQGIRASLQALQARVGSFFEGADNVQQENGDPLLDVVQQYPEEAAWFIKVVMFFGSVSGVLISIPCSVFLFMYWTPCEQCNRPLRIWVLIHCVLQMMQAPVRLVFFMRLRQIQQRNGDIQECVRQLTQSSAWRMSKAVSIVTYGWFILGVVWLLNSTTCKPCPGLYRLTLAVISTAVARLAMTLIIFYHSFPAQQGERPFPKPRGATQDVIDTMPTVKYCPHSHGCSETSCAVCLADFEEGDEMRQLPCKHHFHRPCIDKWLKRNKVCPLCLQDIQATPGASAKKKN
mmetsp:Transcript_21727/g.61729  ORF Transcript_21727/g.61729 Transcript_21727/m.61729 type:complete len:291 (-) Transcript_21727:270-1142(-)